MLKQNVMQTVIAIVGTILLTTTAVAAAVGPARAVETAPRATLI